ncbi:hypothetical protein NP493_1336g00021 [Ridgeia piscesae]|uniref:DUF1330 domain-containing protein n=1 Tax=Ridgeia piscesae TaxID=27915 RepID=A0AAD9NF00_RIDPI|nr:hypothetical protein NP493_1336g00021 [Ridgeia piscesae]
MRFGISRIQSCRNSLFKNLPVHGNYKGHVIGLSADVQVLEGFWPHDKGIAVLHFDTMWDAQMWFNSVPDIKQQDWLDGVDMIAMPMTMQEPVERPFMQLLDMEFYDFERFSKEYSSQATSFWQDRGAKFGVVSTDNIVNFRGLWDARYIVMNLFQSCEDFEKTYNASEYAALKEVRMQTADSNVICCELEPLKVWPKSTC